MVEITVLGVQAIMKGLKDVADRLGDSLSLSVGFLEGGIYTDGTSVAEVAMFQEYGTRTIPPRPFMRKTIATHGEEWAGNAAQLLRENNLDLSIVAPLMGELIKGQIQQSIVEFTEPPNAPSTIRKKGFNKPLIDTGHMLRSVDYNVDI